MEGYVVKVMMYQGADGQLVRKLSDAQLFFDKELADSAAEIANGWLVPVVRVEKNKEQARSPAAPEKACRSNQTWMRGDQ